MRSRALIGGALLTDALVANAQARLLARIDGTAPEMRPAFPHAADSETGRWEAKAGGAWTDGFWVGLCWLAYRLTKADRYRDWGLEWAARLRGREWAMTHDIGFLFQYAAVLGWQTTREAMLRELGLACADRLVAMSHLTARVIPVGAHAEVSSGLDDVTIDCMMNLQVPLGLDDRRPPGMLLHGCYNPYTGEAPDHELIWGDYFLLEALARWQGRR